MIDELLEGSKNGKLAYGDMKRVAQQFACSRKQATTVCKRYKEQKDAGIAAPSLRNKRGGNSGRKGIDLEELRDKLRHIPLKNRTTQRAVAAQLRIPSTTLTDNLKKLGLHASRRYLKPLLTDGGKAARRAWALRWVRQSAAGRVFDDMKGVVMVDEKWFYKFRQGQEYYLCEDEQLPVAKVQHKSHIQKVIFLAAVARPRYDTMRNRNFSGKIGIFPFTRQVQAQRNSRNGAAGTTETKSKLVEVTKEVYKRKMVDEVFPAIKREWPGPPGEVLVQQDNAPAHRINDGPEAAGTADGWNIKLINQPANSPDTNILDLGFSNSIQALQDHTTLNTVDEVIAEVRRVFEQQEPAVLGRVWTTYQSVLQEIMLAKGDNTFKLPHLHKQTAERRGAPIGMALPVSAEAWAAAHTD